MQATKCRTLWQVASIRRRTVLHSGMLLLLAAGVAGVVGVAGVTEVSSIAATQRV